MTTLQQVELGVLGPLQVRQYGLPVAIPGAKPRAILTMLGLHGGSVVSADTLVELLWGDDPPRTAAKALQTHISALRRTLGDGFVLTEGTGWTLSTTEIDATRYTAAAKLGRDAVATGDVGQAVARFDEALALWRGIPELPECPRGASEKTRWIEGHAALVEDRADALLATGRAAEIIGELEASVGDAPLCERRWCQLMLALYRAGRQGEALGAYQRARSLLADELGVDPGPDLRRLEAAIVAQDEALEIPVSHQLSSVTRAVTFLLTDIEGSTAAWEADADAMAVALARHDEIVEQFVTSGGGRLVKTRGEGDATFSVFDRPSAAAAAAIELQEAIRHEPWALAEPMRIRVALHTGEVELRDGDYFGRAVNRAARLRSLAAGDQILCSGATAELVIDTLRDDVLLVDLGMRQLKNLPRPEHVFELRLETADDSRTLSAEEPPMERPDLPAVLAGPGPFVGRAPELERLLAAWQTTLDAGTRAVLIAGEPGVGKTRLAGEWSRQAYEEGAVVLYGRCDEDLGAPYQPFAEALRSLVPCLGSKRLRGMRGVEALLPLIPGLTDALPDLATPARADADTERYALFDAVVALLGLAAASAPVVLILDDLHWAAKPTLLLLRHLLRFGEHARVQIIGTYRSTDLDRSHPLAAMLADLHRDGSAHRLALSGLDEEDVTAYLAEAGYDDEELARALASVTGGNPFFLIEALRHVDESGGRWDPSTLPQGVREAVSRRLSRLPAETNKALAAAAVVGSRFALDLVERVTEQDLIDAFDEACKAGILIEEPGGRYRFNHALVRQSLLAELASVRRMRLHQRIAVTLETEPGADDELLAELAYHYFECAWAGNAAKAVDYCRRAADQAMARLAYEGAADHYDRALHALDELDDELPDRDDLQAELLVARCEALLAAGDVVSATGAVAQLQAAAGDSARLAAWGTCFGGELSMLTDPERLDEIESAVGVAAETLAGLEDAAGEAKAHTVRATCLGRLGRVGDCETALDQALTAARRAGEHRRVNAVLANAPLAALWGPNPVPRAGGRCLDVVRLLRITTGSAVVEATSTRCQGVLDAFRGRATAGRQLIESARRSLTELGMRHALLEVEQFAGIVELVADDPAAAEPYLRRAYNGFRRMGLDADTAETAALLARACLELDRDAEADELCRESERLAGHALKASMTWRTVRAQLLARQGDHEEARRVAEEAVALAGRTDALVDHGDACLALATVLGAAGDAAGARAAAERAVGLYELKGAAALAEKARHIVGARDLPSVSIPPEEPSVELENACVRALAQLHSAVDREAWDELEHVLASDISVRSHRKVVGFSRVTLGPEEWTREAKRLRELGFVRHRHVVVAVRGARLALTRTQLNTADASAGAPQDEVLQLIGLDNEGRIAMDVWFDLEDLDAAIAELDAMHARFEEQPPRAPLENAASRAETRLNALFAESRWDEIGAMLTDDVLVEERRRAIRREGNGRATLIAEMRVIADLGVKNMTSEVLAIRGERLVLSRVNFTGRDGRPDAFHTEILRIGEMDVDGRMAATVTFDLDDFDAAFEELDSRYAAGEAADHARTWSAVAEAYAALNRRELPATTPDWVNIDHQQVTTVAPGDFIANIRASWEVAPELRIDIEAVHQLSDLGAVITHAGHGTSQAGFDAEWRTISLYTVDRNLINRCELFGEADLDAAIARFDELSRPTPQLENAANRVRDRYIEHFATRDWAAMAEMLTDDFSTDDRRRVVNAGVRRGRDAEIADLRAIADVGTEAITSTAIATRGERLVLCRMRSSAGERPEAFHVEALDILEVDADERIVAHVVFDLGDIDAAFAELDARYLAGEAAGHAQTWSVITQAYASFNRHELPNTTPDLVSVDHRRGTRFAPGELIDYIRAGWELSPEFTNYIRAVHRLTDLGAVVTHASYATSRAGFDAEWQDINLLTVDSDVINRSELFNESDLDAALAHFDELSRPAARLENTASRAYDRLNEYFAARDWDAMADAMAENMLDHDRRHTVSGGIRRGRDAEIANSIAVVALGGEKITSTIIATRGERLALCRSSIIGSGKESGEFRIEFLSVIEIDADDRFAAHLAFDLDDFDAAFEELDARYLAGEAAAYSPTWSVMAQAFAATNRREMPEFTPDFVSIDHRRARAFTPGDLAAYIRATWDLAPDVIAYAEAVHKLSDLGAVFTQAVSGTSQGGFEAEWREIVVATIDGTLINRIELFEEADLDTALARFEELSRPSPRLENAASRAEERFRAGFAAGDWTELAGILADDFSNDDRRPVVGAGVRHGRDAQIADMRAIAALSITNITSSVIATRGERLVLVRIAFPFRDQASEAFLTETLSVVETDADERIVAFVSFNPDNLDAAVAELDARYLRVEAAAHAQVWSVIARNHAAFNRGEPPKTTPDWVNIDHRRGPAFEAGHMASYIHATWDVAPAVNVYIEAVHRLSDLGTVFTQVSYGTSREGFDAEWRMLNVSTVDGELISGCELFDEADLDAALARFDELSRPTPRLENAASQVVERYLAHFAGRLWDPMAEMLTEDILTDDRRKVVNGGIRRGRDAEIANLRSVADIGAEQITPTVIATRGKRLVLNSTSYSMRDWPEEFRNETIDVVEMNADNRLSAHVVFDPDDIDAAFEELDARYLAGEAAAYAQTWSAITSGYAALNRHEMPRVTPDFVNIDHRPGVAFASGDLLPYIHAAWDVSPDLKIHVETVHRLNNLGAVITHAARGSSQEGFDAEWRQIVLFTVDGVVNRCEMYEETDLDAALAKFDELSRATPRLENAASQVAERFCAHFSARDWTAVTEIVAQNVSVDDRRRVVGAGVRHGREAEVENLRIWAAVGIGNFTSDVIATRGLHLALCRARWSGPDQRSQAFRSEALGIVEINADNQIAARVMLDADDIDAAIAELDARYLAGEAAPYAPTWSVVERTIADFNRRQLATTGWLSVDHRRGTPFGSDDLNATIRSMHDLTPDVRTHVEAVHRLSGAGAVFTCTSHGTSHAGFEAEWRIVVLLVVDGDHVHRCELFDEGDLDAAIARFDELSRSTPRLENAASRMHERFNAYLAARDWDAMAAMLADDTCDDDRRRVVSGGIQRGRDAQIANLRAVVDVGVRNIELVVIATRGERLALSRARVSGGDQLAEAFGLEMLSIVEIDTDDRIAVGISFDVDDIDAAFEELDSRYAAGEAGEHSRAWAVMTQAYAVLNRRGLPATTPRWVNVDHRRGTSFAPGDMTAYISAAWADLEQDLRIHIEAVHRLSDRGAVLTQVLKGTTHEGFDAEWRTINLYTVDADLIDRCELFEEADIDTALARFDELTRLTPPLENAASRVDRRFQACFAARDWDAMAEMLSDGTSIEDRRRVVNAGNVHGRDAELTVHAYAAVGSENVSTTVVAIRGQRLALSNYRFSGGDQRPDAFRIELLAVVEIDADERMAAVVTFDFDDIDAAFEELDSRYIAGEAAAYPHTWSIIAETAAGLNRREIPATTPDYVDIDHRSHAPIEDGDLKAYIGAVWDLTPDITIYIESVHRLSNLGAVVTYAARGTSQEGFDAEWREIVLGTVEGDLISRCELFDDTDLDAALARFDELSRPTPRLENEATRVYQRLQAYFMASDWDALTDTLADDHYGDDRRRVVNSGIRHGRDAEIASMHSIADIGVTTFTSTPFATRGDRLALCRIRGATSGPEVFRDECLRIVEIDAADRIKTRVVFDLDDIDAAFEELEARFVAGEAATHAHTWSVIARNIATFNRGEPPTTTPDWVNIDHRRGPAFEPGHMASYIRATWDVAPAMNVYIEAVHRLSDLGTVFTQVVRGTTRDGFDAEWRDVVVITIDGDLINRIEVFDEPDFDAAIARFEELQPRAPKLENAASRVGERFLAHFAAHDWDAMADQFADGYSQDDRRRTVNSGVRHGRDAAMEDIRSVVDVGLWANLSVTAIATRGGRLALNHFRASAHDPEAAQLDVLQLIEIDADERFAACVVFDPDDIDAAFQELEARYAAGEAAVHSHTWSLIARNYAAFNRHEFPSAAPDWVTIDHRRGASFEPGDLAAYIRSTWDIAPDTRVCIESVHRVSDRGAVITQVSKGTSQLEFEVEWREICLLTIDGELFSGCELFDEADLDAALARFDELSRPAPRLENAASRMYRRYNAYFAARDWDAMAEMVTDDICTDDRRRVVSGGIQRGRDAQTANMRAVAGVGVNNVESSVIATRGDHLALIRARVSGDQRPEAFGLEMLTIVEIDADNRFAAGVLFDPDDLDAAFDELDARYLAGEGDAHARTWSVIANVFAILNRREIPATTPDYVDIDHRSLAPIESGDLEAFVRAAWDVTPDVRICVEAVHQLSDLGGVVTFAARGTSREGFTAEWREILVLTVEGDVVSRCEVFDEADLDAALARFDELSSPARQLENLANQVSQRFLAYFTARDWNAMAEILAHDTSTEDRRPLVGVGLRRGREAVIADWRATAEVGVKSIEPAVIATRGGRLVLSRYRFSGRDQRPDAFHTDALGVLEIDANQRIAACIMFDADDIDAAFEELETRYLAGEAASHAHTWSNIVRITAAFNQHEIPPATPNWVNIDHRRGTAFAPGELTAYLHAAWEVTPQASLNIEAVHRLDDLGAVVTYVGKWTSQDGFTAEWRVINLVTVEGDLISRIEVFDEADLDTALARFDELSRPTPWLENVACEVTERFMAQFAKRDWDAMAEILAEDICYDDRRPLVGTGVIRGRDAEIANLQATADIGVKNIAPTPIATRGERLALSRVRLSGRDQRPEAFHTEAFTLVKINADNRIAAIVVFDLADIDAAFVELDGRYLAGEAAAHAHTWSVIARTFAAYNRREFPPTTPDWVNIDHRRGTSFGPGDLFAYIRSAWDDMPDGRTYIQAGHRLSDLGVVITYRAEGTTREGFEAEWREIALITVDGDLINRGEMFDEADLDAALARFDELSQPTPRLENAATQIIKRFWSQFAARDWDAVTETLAEGICHEDRRRVVNAGIRHGRAAVLADMQTIAEVGVTNMSSTVIATRGARLALVRASFSGSDQWLKAVIAEELGIVEISADNRLEAYVAVDVDNLDAAFAELEARYAAREAADYALTWSAIVRITTAFNRREVPATTPNFVSLDHRRGTAFAPGELTAYLHATWEVTPQASLNIEAVHRLNDLGAVVTHVGQWTSQDGFTAEWRVINLVTVEGDLISRIEVFEEADLAAAIARFDEMRPQVKRLENAASRAADRFFAYFRAQNWAAIAEILTDNSFIDDRHDVANAGFWDGRDVVIANLRALADAAPKMLSVIATRGDRLALIRICSPNRDARHGEFSVEMLVIAEIDTNERITAQLAFDVDDVDAAFKDLDRRYAAGEAAAYSHTWSLITEAYVALNRRELPPTTPDWVNVDHCHVTTIEPGDLFVNARVSWELAPDICNRIEVVHRLSSLGAVVTRASSGTSQEGFNAEWRHITVVTIDGDLINRVELFDEADLDAALARFDELNRPAPQLENAATRAWARVVDATNRRDVDDFLALAAADGRYEDRRKGLRDEGPARPDVVRALFAITKGMRLATETVAIRGTRLSLTRDTYRDAEDVDRPITGEHLTITEVDDDNLVRNSVRFDPDDINGAFAELTARWIASGEVEHPEVIEAVCELFEAANRHDWDALATIEAGATHVNHRQLATGVDTIDDHWWSLRTMAALIPDLWVEVAEILTHSATGLVTNIVVKGMTAEGTAIELPADVLILFDGPRMTRMEAFDVDQRDQALARFEEFCG